jgi:invasion protein IalB
MTIRIVSAPARPVLWSLATTVAALALFAVPAAQAQAPAPAPAAPAAPKAPAKKPAAPKAPAPAAQAPAAAPQQPPAAQAAPPPVEMPQFVYSPWTKLCGPPPNTPNNPNGKLVCFTGREMRTEAGMPVVAAALIEMDGEATKTFRITLPFGLAVARGTRIIVDQNQPMQMPFMTCAGLSANMGCIAQYEGSPQFIDQLKKGQMLTIQALNLNEQVVSFPMSLAEFGKANEGPPTDPKVIEAQQKKMQEDLQKKADELRKKLEQQQGAPSAAAPK